MATTQEPSCSTCLKPQSTCLPDLLRRCAKCKSTLYCSRACQAADWKASHKQTNANKEAHEAGLKVLEQELGCKEVPTTNDGLDAARKIMESHFGADFIKISKLS